MPRLGSIVMAVAAATFTALLAPASAAATTWGVPGNGSNVCTVPNPNCNTIAQAATAASSGDTIQLGAGAHAVTGTIVLTKTLTFTGAGIGTTIVQPAAGIAAFSVRTNDIVFQDFTIQNGATGIAFQSASSNNTQITRVHFSGQTSRGIDVSLAATFLVSNVVITDCQFAVAAIAIRTSSTAQVAGMTITGTSFTGGTYGLYVANDGSTSKFSGLTVQNTSFTNVGGAAQTYAIYAEELRDAVIEDSTFSGGRAGVGLLKFYSSNGVAVSNITILRNTFSGFTANALDLEVFAGGSTPGVGLENPITVEDNTFQKDVSISLSSPAIFVRLPPALTNAAVSILDNDVSLSGTFGGATQAHGIQLRGNGPVVITGNTIDGGNVGGTGTAPPSSGVSIQSQSGTTIMPATTTITASCNRIQGFRNGVSVFDNVGNVYGGLPVGAAVTLTDNAILGNDDGVVTGAAPPTIAAENNYWGCPLGPTDAACDSAVGDVDATPFLSTIPACVACVANGECDDGLFCSGGETCGAGSCVAGGGDPCLGGPACENLCNEAADNCFVPAGTVCRTAAGVCDVQETCTGLGGGCPADAVEPNTTVCRASAGVCDVAETCDGSSIACPADAFEPASTTCRPAAGVCDLAETCNGVGAACPADVKSTAVCRGSAGICDVAETCNGVSDACPANGFQPSTMICRPSASACDLDESCTGSGAGCPADTGLPDTDTDTVCDALDNCDTIPNTDQANNDSDSFGDACDPCTNIVPTVPSKTKLLLSKILPPATDDKLNFKGFFTAVPNSPTVNPIANGLRVLVSDSLGNTPIDVTIPGGAYDPVTKIGWKVNGSGTAWKYSNSTSPVNGLYKAQLKAYSSTPGKYKFAVKGKNGNYVVNTLNLPLKGTLVIDVPYAETGQCGETAFQTPPTKPNCSLTGGGKNVKCK